MQQILFIFIITLFTAVTVNGQQLSPPFSYDKESGVTLDDALKSYDKKTGISRDPEFAYLAGWGKSGFLIFKKYRRLNVGGGLLDSSEADSLKSAFIVNAKSLLTDNTYPCKRPLLAAYLSKKLKLPIADEKCKSTSTVRISDNDGVWSEVLDESRLYAVDYLFASRGKALMSRWGHAMFRLVFCAPDRKAKDEDCRKDVAHHLVLSFRAGVDDFKLNYFKGTFGGYPSLAYLLPFLNVVEEYTKVELRDLISLPLKLSDEEKHKFFIHVFEQNWSYEGDYRFLTRNCAHESLWFLKTIADDQDDEIMKLNVGSPVALYRKLSRIGRIDKTLVRDRKEALKKGYLFLSKGALLKEAYANAGEKQKNYEKLKAFDRKESFEKKKEKSDQMIASYIVIESRVRVLREQELLGKISETLFDLSKNGGEGFTKEECEMLLKIVAKLSNPLKETEEYGIPEAGNEKPLLTKEEALKAESLMTKFKELIDLKFTSEISEIKATDENLKLFKRSVRTAKES